MTTSFSIHPLCDVLRPRSSILAGRAEQLIERAEALLSRAVATFPTGTEHGPPHTRTVEAITCALLTNEFLSELSDYELFFLAVACHYHDLGMVGTEADNESAEAKDRVRAQHALRIRESLLREWHSLGFDSEAEASILAEICVGHRPKRDAGGHASWSDFPEHRAVGPGPPVRVRLLCAIIYAVDELHIGHDRAPERVEALAGITNVTSLKHWHRHQRTIGPALYGDKLQFDARVSTLDVEQDLRDNHLRKALVAVSDMRELATNSGIKSRARTIVLQWDRAALWSLLLIEQLRDMRPRSREDVVADCLGAYEARQGDMVDLSQLCEVLNDGRDKQRIEAERCIDQWLQLERLVVVDGAMRLSIATEVHKTFYDLLQSADNDDAHIAGATHSQHLFRVLGDQYGREYLAEYVIPHVRESYAVFLSNDCGVPSLLDAIKSFPTAAAIASRFIPPATAVEKRECLAVVAAAGALLDALREPALLLNQDARHSLREIVRYLPEVLPKYLTYLEELAVVLGFKLEQIQSLMLPNDDGTEEPDDEDETNPNTVRITITQTIARNRSVESAGFWYHMLAQRRSGGTVRLIQSPTSGVSVQFPEGAIPPELAAAGCAMIGIGPGQPIPPAIVDMPCSARLISEEAIVCFDLYAFNSEGADDCPFLISLPMRKTFFAPGSASISFSARHGRTRLKDVRLIHELATMLKTSGVTVKLVLAAVGQTFAQSELAMGQPCPLHADNAEALLETFAGIADDVVLPYHLEFESVRTILLKPAEARQGALETLRADAGDDAPVVSRVVSRRLTESGVVYREKGLFMARGDVFSGLNVTFADGDDVSQEQFAEQWRRPTSEHRVQTSSGDTCSAVEKALIDWSNEPSGKPFPLRYDSAAAPLPEIKSSFTLVRGPLINRGWYSELPIVFEIRSPTRRESLVAEHAYWTHIGDAGRAAIVGERIAEIDAVRST